MKRFKNRPEDWGDFVDVKVNAAEALAKQMRKIKPPKEVFMSSVGDAWQPLEAKYKLSRACLKLLLEAGFEVDILTKSSLILRDFDLLSAYKTPRLGMTITTLDLRLQKVLEPYASESQERLNTLKKAREKGIKTWVFLGPLIPEFTDTPANLEALFRALQGLDLDQIYVDRLNPRWGVLETLKKGLSREEYTNWRLMLYKSTSPAKYSEYSRKLRQRTGEFASQFGLSNKLTICF
jgi:DNA repair photolyase